MKCVSCDKKINNEDYEILLKNPHVFLCGKCRKIINEELNEVIEENET